MPLEISSKDSPFYFRALTTVLKVFFQLLYHQFAWTYDLVAAVVSLGRWGSWVRATLPYLNGPKVLELGHGPGHLQAELLESGVKAYGMDASPQMGRLALAIVWRRIRKCPFLVNGYAQFIPFPDASFDQAVATFPTEYIYEPATIREIYRVLAPGGRLVILLVAWITGQGLVERGAAWLFRVTKQAPPDLPQANARSDLRKSFGAQLVDRLEKAGFRVQIEFSELRSSVLMIVLADKV